MNIKQRIVFNQLCQYIFHKDIKFHYREFDTSKELKEHYATTGYVGIRFSDGLERFIGCNVLNDLVRACHDYSHIEHNTTFKRDDELLTADYCYSDMLASGVVDKSLAYLIWLDTVSQVFYYDKYGKFVKNQCNFLKDVNSYASNLKDAGLICKIVNRLDEY